MVALVGMEKKEKACGTASASGEEGGFESGEEMKLKSGEAELVNVDPATCAAAATAAAKSCSTATSPGSTSQQLTDNAADSPPAVEVEGLFIEGIGIVLPVDSSEERS